MAEDYYFAGADSKVGICTQSDFYDPDPDAAETAPTWASGTKIAAVEGWEFTVKADHKKLYKMGSTKRIAVARCNFGVEGKLAFAKFDPTVGTWWVMKIPNSAGGGSIADTNNFTWFLLYGSLNPATSTNPVFGAKLYNVHFSNLPIGASEHEWIKVDLSFKATHPEFLNTAVTFS